MARPGLDGWMDGWRKVFFSLSHCKKVVDVRKVFRCFFFSLSLLVIGAGRGKTFFGLLTKSKCFSLSSQSSEKKVSFLENTLFYNDTRGKINSFYTLITSMHYFLCCICFSLSCIYNWFLLLQQLSSDFLSPFHFLMRFNWVRHQRGNAELLKKSAENCLENEKNDCPDQANKDKDRVEENFISQHCIIDYKKRFFLIILSQSEFVDLSWCWLFQISISQSFMQSLFLPTFLAWLCCCCSWLIPLISLICGSITHNHRLETWKGIWIWLDLEKNTSKIEMEMNRRRKLYHFT